MMTERKKLIQTHANGDDDSDPHLAEITTDATYLFHDTKENDPITGDEEENKRICDAVSMTMLCAMVFSTTVSVCCCQALGGLIPQFELNMWRFAAHLIIISPITIVKKISVIPSKEHITWIGIICLMYNFYNIFYFESTTHLPLGTIAGVSRGATLIIVSLVTVTLFKECTSTVALSCSLCTLGMFFVSQPYFIFVDLIENINMNHTSYPLCDKTCDSGNNETIPYSFFHNVSTSDTSEPCIIQDNGNLFNEVLGYVLLLFSSTSMCIIYFVRNKKVPNVNFVFVSLWVGICGFVLSFVLMFIFEEPTLPSSTTCIFLLCGHAICESISTSANLFVLQKVSPVILALSSSLQLVLLGISQYTFMKHINPGKGNALEITGFVTIFIGTLVGPLYQYCLES